MFEPQRVSAGAGAMEHAPDMLEELERNTPEELRRQRAHFRLTVKCKLFLQPGNSSEMLKFKVQGVTGDLSQGGCKALLPTPVRVGDVYRLDFDGVLKALPLTFARCIRCQLLREDAFEAGFRFFTPIELPEAVSIPPRK